MNNKKQTYLRIFFHNLMKDPEIMSTLGKMINENISDINTIDYNSLNQLIVYLDTPARMCDYYILLDKISSLICEVVTIYRDRAISLINQYKLEDKEIDKYLDVTDIDNIIINNYANKFLIHLILINNSFVLDFM